MAKAKKKEEVVAAPAEPLLLDFGAGKNKKPGFKGVDVRPYEGIDFVLDIANSHWP